MVEYLDDSVETEKGMAVPVNLELISFDSSLSEDANISPPAEALDFWLERNGELYRGDDAVPVV